MVKVFLLIVVGLAGDANHAELFQKWGTQLASSADKLGVAKERLVYLVDQAEGTEKRGNGPATSEAAADQDTE